jgi:hypothetical protein
MGGILITRPGRLQQATAGTRSVESSGEALAQGLSSFANGARSAFESSVRIQQNVSNAYVAREEPRIALEMEKRLEELRLQMDGSDPGAFTATVAEEMAAKIETELASAPELARGALGNRMRRLTAQVEGRALQIESAAAVRHISESFTQAGDLNANRLLSNPDLFEELAGDMGEDIGMLDQPEEFKREIVYQSLRKLAFGALAGRIEQPTTQGSQGNWLTGPERALFELTETDYWDSKLSDDEKRALINAAQAEISRRAAAEKAESNANKKFLRDKLTDYIDSLTLGRTDVFVGDTGTALAMADALDDSVITSDLNEAIEAQSLTADFRQLGLPGMEARRDALLARVNAGPTTEIQQRFLAGMDKIIGETEEMARRDPIGGLVTAGLIGGRPILTMNPQTGEVPSAQEWQNLGRIGLMAEDYYNRADIGLLAPQQAAAMARAMRDMPPDDVVSNMSVMAANLPQRMVRGIAAQLWEQNEDAMATAVALTVEDRDVAELIVRGQRIVDSDQFALNDNAIRAAIPDSYYSLFTNHPSLYDSVIPAAVAVYAASVPARKLQSGEAIGSSDFRDALDAVTGGLVEFNGEATIVPRRGMTQDDFNYLMDQVVERYPDDFSFLQFGRTVLNDGSASPLGDAGIPGGVGGFMNAEKFRRHAQLRPHSDGVYYVMMGGRPILGTNQKPFLLDVGAMFDAFGTRSTQTWAPGNRPVENQETLQRMGIFSGSGAGTGIQ